MLARADTRVPQKPEDALVPPVRVGVTLQLPEGGTGAGAEPGAEAETGAGAGAGTGTGTRLPQGAGEFYRAPWGSADTANTEKEKSL